MTYSTIGLPEKHLEIKFDTSYTEMNEAVKTWNENHPNQLMVLNRFENTYIINVYRNGEGKAEIELSVTADSFRKAWDEVINLLDE